MPKGEFVVGHCSMNAPSAVNCWTRLSKRSTTYTVPSGATAMLLGGAASDETEGEPVVVEVAEGMGASSVADLLEDRGVIRSAFAFRVTARFDERANQIKPGTYELQVGMSHDEILELLSTGPAPPDTFRVTIPEGLTVDQTLQRFADAPGSPFTVEELETALQGVPLPAWVPADLPEDAEPFEGLLFPETYEFRTDTDAQAILTRLVAQTEQILDQITPPEGLDRYDVLIIGSLIEREARLRDEQRTISAVMHNRLAADMALQIDATVLYALGEHRDRVLYADLEVDSLWNTYRYPGLPPTPISGAGRAALEAAADPTDEDYLYYVVIDPETGEHGFSRTLDEHNQLRAQVREDS
jgi:UPF0755 protein